MSLPRYDVTEQPYHDASTLQSTQLIALHKLITGT
jgi:hypothetical protein